MEKSGGAKHAHSHAHGEAGHSHSHGGGDDHDESGEQTGELKTTTFNVEMDCAGCAGGCTRALKKVAGVIDVNALLDAQKVTVKYDDSLVDATSLLSALEKWAEKEKKKVSQVA